MHLRFKSRERSTRSLFARISLPRLSPILGFLFVPRGRRVLFTGCMYSTGLKNADQYAIMYLRSNGAEETT